MYWFKKIARAILNLLPLFLVLFIPGQTHALSHDLTGIPVYKYVPVVTNKYTGTDYVFSNLLSNDLLTFHVNQATVPNPTVDMSKSSAPIFFNSRYNQNASDPKCVFNISYGYNATGRWGMDSNNFTAPPFTVFSKSVNGSNNASALSSRCQQGQKFGSNGVLEMDWQSLRRGFAGDNAKTTAVMSLKPYYYEYSAYQFKGNKTYNGKVYESKNFTLDNLIGDGNTDLIKSMDSINIPFGNFHNIQSSDFTSIGNGTHIDFNFSILIQANSTLDISDIQNTQPRLYYGYIYYNNQVLTNEEKYSTCTINTTDSDQYMANIDFSCSMDFDKDVVENYVSVAFNWIAPSGGDLFIANDGISIFSIEGGNFIPSIITDYDDTPGEDIGPVNDGARPWHAPGAPGYDEIDDSDVIQDGVNWTKSFTNLFDFTIINPFAPLFNLFKNGDECASIPTIAGMIHSEETTVCPWFDSQTRSIVTPVLGLSSVMIVFGLVVRWLKSGSGNNETDTGGDHA